MDILTADVWVRVYLCGRIPSYGCNLLQIEGHIKLTMLIETRPVWEPVLKYKKIKKTPKSGKKAVGQ